VATSTYVEVGDAGQRFGLASLVCNRLVRFDHTCKASLLPLLLLLLLLAFMERMKIIFP